MSFKCGIIGLPNVGKSTLFNALTASLAAEAANYPFCTIEPNNRSVDVPDERLNRLAAIAASKQIIPAQIEFVDIAGLVKGASKGEGLGNKFLAHIREVDAIIHVLRCFEDADVIHVHDHVDPLSDAEVVETELILADLESIEKRIPNLEKKAKNGDKDASEQLELLKKIAEQLYQGKPARVLIKDKDDLEIFKTLGLLTSKPLLYVSNVSEKNAATGNDLSTKITNKAKQDNTQNIIISSKIEAEISLMDKEEKFEFLTVIGLSETGLDKIVKASFELLQLKKYFTVGPQEARAWIFSKGTTAPAAAGIIHTDFQKGFIKAAVISYEDYIIFNGENKAKEAGRLRLEGKEYLVNDGDIIHFRFNV